MRVRDSISYLGLVAAGCAPSVAAKTAGHIGCPKREIVISDYDVSAGWGKAAHTWTARCRGREFICTEERTMVNSQSVPSGYLGAISCREVVPTAQATPADSAGRTGVDVGQPHPGAMEPSPAPAGFALGAAAEPLRLTCETAGHQWTADAPTRATCSGAAVDPGFPAEVSIAFHQERADQVVLTHTPQADWLAASGAIRRALTDKYGVPAERVFVVPDECRTEARFFACLEDRRARVEYTWRLKSGVHISLEIGRPAGTAPVPPAIRIRYTLPRRAMNSQGL